jgi:hypothetical protein
MARHASVREAAEAARESILDLAELQVVNAAAAGNLSACYFILKTLGAQRGYSESVVVQAAVTTRDVTPRSLRTDYRAYNAAYVEHLQAVYAAAKTGDTTGRWLALMDGEAEGDDAVGEPDDADADAGE